MAQGSAFCSFCGKPESEVAKLIAGTAAHICDACVSLCVDILADSPPIADTDQVLVRLPDGSVQLGDVATRWHRLKGDDDLGWCCAERVDADGARTTFVCVRRSGWQGIADGVRFVPGGPVAEALAETVADYI